MAIDWQEHYAVEPLLVETLVDPTRYRGTSYRAANWIELGGPSGQARVYRQPAGAWLLLKQCYVCAH